MKTILFTLAVGLAGFSLIAQETPPERRYIDAILERPGVPTSQEIEVLDLTGDHVDVPDGQVDVRDLVVFLDGLPVSASFGSSEFLAFHSDGSVTLPIYFSKPVQGTVLFDLGGNALTTGIERDITLLESAINLSEPSRMAEITILFEPWQGFGGERIVRLSLKRDPEVIPANGTFPSHLLRIRQFDAGEFVGMLTFPPVTGLPALPVRIGLASDGRAICSFQEAGTLLGEELNYGWSPGYAGFPNFLGETGINIPGETFSRENPVHVVLSISRMPLPYPDEVAASLDAFSEDNQPALYYADLVLPNLLAAGAAFTSGEANPFAIAHRGQLTLQPVRYAEAP